MITFMDILVIFSVSAVIIVGIVGVVFFVHYFKAKEDCLARLSFRQFKALYSINPDKWGLHEMWVGYEGRAFYFSMVDAIRYELNRAKITRDEEEAAHNKELAEIIAEWQKDIDAYKASIKQEGAV